MLALSLLILGACKDTDGVTTEDFVPAKELILPDLSNIDMESAFTEAIKRTAGIQLNPAWNGNRSVLNYRRPNCPDLYVGGPSTGMMATNVSGGVSWSDYCSLSSAGLEFSGYVYWDGSVSQQGNPEDPSGLTIQGDRTMIGQGTVKYQNDLFFEFKGEGQDSMYLVEAPDGYRRWTYSALIQGTINGSEAVEPGEGFRSDMYIYATGGDVASLEARGNAYWSDYLIEDKFDSTL